MVGLRKVALGRAWRWFWTPLPEDLSGEASEDPVSIIWYEASVASTWAVRCRGLAAVLSVAMLIAIRFSSEAMYFLFATAIYFHARGVQLSASRASLSRAALRAESAVAQRLLREVGVSS